MRLLLVTSRFPLPPWRGNQVRTIQWLEALAGHHVAVVCPSGDPKQALAELASEVHTYDLGPFHQAAGVISAGARGWPVQEGLFAVPAARGALDRALVRGPWDLVVVQMVRCGWAADVLASAVPELPMLFDAIDSMALHFRRGRRHFPTLLGPLVAAEARRPGELEIA